MIATREPQAKTARVNGMFARIAHRYDLMNRLMSAGRDQAWRAEAARLAAPAPGARALDVATGTADLAIALRARECDVVGLDTCDAMLRLGQDKAGSSTRFILGDAHSLPFQGEAFNCVTVAFGVRNMADPLAAFQEMHRVLSPGGRAVCLETMPPDDSLLGHCYQLYLNRFIPHLGGWVTGEPEAYRYFSSSVMTFRDSEGLKAVMLEAGFSSVEYHLLNLGTMAIHVGVKGL